KETSVTSLSLGLTSFKDRMKMDWSPRSRTSNPHSRSPAASPQALGLGECFATGARGVASSGGGDVLEGTRLTDVTSRTGLDRGPIGTGDLAKAGGSDIGADWERASACRALRETSHGPFDLGHRVNSCRRPPGPAPGRTPGRTSGRRTRDSAARPSWWVP